MIAGHEVKGAGCRRQCAQRERNRRAVVLSQQRGLDGAANECAVALLLRGGRRGRALRRAGQLRLLLRREPFLLLTLGLLARLGLRLLASRLLLGALQRGRRLL